MFKRVALAASLACALVVIAGAQNGIRHWTEWKAEDINRILNDSAWGQTQTETDTSEMFYTPTTQGQGRSTRGGVTDPLNTETVNNRAQEGALNQAVSIKFRIRWFSSRPIRQALARQAELQRGKAEPGLRAFANGPVDKRAVVAVTFEATDQRQGGKVMQAFNSAVTSTLKNSTYLERKDGRRVFLQEYIPPTHNQLGAAMFVFPRTVGEGPLLTPESGEVRFVSEIMKNLKLNMKFKVSDMVYAGRLEY